MSMKEPSPRASRLALTAGIVAVAVVGGGGFLLGRHSTTSAPAAVTRAVVAPVPRPTPTANTARMLGRADLLALAAEAADAAASGESIPASVRDAAGKPFEIWLPFGCEGPADAESNAPMRWRYDDATGALRVNVTPVTWSPDEWWKTDTTPQAETIEGFWIPRPWTQSEECPSSQASTAPLGAEPITLSGQTLAIGQAFGTDSTRQGRRDGKAYASVLRMARTAVDGSRGLTLRLAGRIGADTKGNALTCRQPGGADQRPVCLILVSLEEVAIAEPVSKKLLATWPFGSVLDRGKTP